MLNQYIIIYNYFFSKITYYIIKYYINKLYLNKMYIYALKLNDNKYYCGKTDNLDIRIKQHQDGIGSAWTKKYGVVETLFTYISTSCFDEDKTTKELMLKYGIQNVRGGTYCSEYLSKLQESLLTKEIWASNNCCNRCGKTGHFINSCKNRKDIYGNIIVSKSIAKKSIKMCKRCNRTGHNKNDCFAKTKLDGSIIKIITCSLCHNVGHTKNKCNIKLT